MYSGEGVRRANVVWSLRTWLQSYNGACYVYVHASRAPCGKRHAAVNWAYGCTVACGGEEHGRYMVAVLGGLMGCVGGAVRGAGAGG
jgi:hypothetical protein